MAGHQLCRYQTFGMGTETTHRADTETNQILCPRKENASAQEISAVTSIIHQAMNYWFTENWSAKLVVQSNRYSRTLGPAFLLFEAEMTEKKSRKPCG